MPRTTPGFFILLFIPCTSWGDCTLIAAGAQTVYDVSSYPSKTLAALTVRSSLTTTTYAPPIEHKIGLQSVTSGGGTASLRPINAYLSNQTYWDRGESLATWVTSAYLYNGSPVSSYSTIATGSSFAGTQNSGEAAQNIPLGGTIGTRWYPRVLPNYAYRSLKTATLTSLDYCRTAIQWSPSLTMTESVNVRSTLRAHNVLILDNSVDIVIHTPMRVEVPIRLTSDKSHLDFGRLLVGETNTTNVSLTVKGTPQSRVLLHFTYDSDTDTNESLSISGTSLPYSTTLTIPSNDLIRTDVYRVGITAATAGNVRGRLLITARVT